MFYIDLEACRYAQSYEGTQVLIEGDTLGFAPLAKALSDASENPVMLLYIYDSDYWGYDFTVEMRKITSTPFRTTSAQSARKKNSA